MQGRLISKPPNFNYGWNVDLVGRANDSYEKQMEAKRQEDTASNTDTGLAEHMSTGHKNFLRSAVYFLYVYNRKDDAAKWYKYMVDLYPQSIPVPGLSLDEYCVSRVQEDAGETDHNQTKAVIGGLLLQAFQYAAIGEDDQFVGHKSLAIQLHNRFEKEIGISTERVGLPPFEKLERQVLEDLFRPNSPYMHPVLIEQLRLVLKLPEEYGKNLEPFPDPQQPVQGPAPEPVPRVDLPAWSSGSPFRNWTRRKRAARLAPLLGNDVFQTCHPSRAAAGPSTVRAWPSGTTPSALFAIRVVDAETGRGVPLVELETVNHLRFYTDSNGTVAFREPGLMSRQIFFHVRSHGYEYPKDSFGYRGVRLKTTPGTEAVLKLKRLNIAERLYRVTGAGIYRDNRLLGRSAPIEQPLLNGMVFGSDSVVTAVYRGKLHWFWGDTNRPSYPLGNFHVPFATSLLPGQGGSTPASA